MTVIKYTKSYELNLKVELHDEKSCDGCPARVGQYTQMCAILSQPLPTCSEKTPEGHYYYYLGRHSNCPLVKVPEREPVITPIKEADHVHQWVDVPEGNLQFCTICPEKRLQVNGMYES